MKVVIILRILTWLQFYDSSLQEDNLQYSKHMTVRCY
jgi:hypothetical protein